MEDNMREKKTAKFFFATLLLAFLTSTSFAWEPWEFIVTADSRSNSHSDHNGVNVAILSEIADEIVTHNPDFFLFAGDLSVGSTNKEDLEIQFLTWRGTMQPVYDAGIPVYAVRGNHDCYSYPSCLEAWNNVFSGPYTLPNNGPAGESNLTYSVAHKNVLALALDELQTPNHSKNYVHQTWIDAVLAANDKPHIFAFGHFTAFKMIWDSLGDHPTDRDLFWDSLENAGGRTYFCGHEHFHDRASADDDGDPNNDLYQYVIGSAGASAHDWEDGNWTGDNSGRTLTSIYHTIFFGYVIVEIDGFDVTLTWMERQNNDPEIPGIYQPKDVWSYTVCGDAAHPYPTGDLDKDCHVDYRDFAIFALAWATKPGDAQWDPNCDIRVPADNVVDILDLAVFVEEWLTAPDILRPSRASNLSPHDGAKVSVNSLI